MPWYANESNDKLWYEDQGTGPVLVLLHGWCMSSTVWRPQLDGLSATFRVIAPDLAGHGRSMCSSGAYGFADFAADITSLFRHLDLQRALLAGWSMGGQVALLASTHLKERLAGLVLVATTPRFTATADFPWGLAPVEATGMALKLRRNATRALDGFTARMFAAGELDDPAQALQIRALLAAVPIPDTNVALQSLQALVDADMRDLLPLIDLPTLVINGDRDIICRPEASDYLAQQISSSSRVIMHGCGHAPFLTRGREFDTCLDDFSRRVHDLGNR